jgi:hypothetical protein
MIEVNGIWAGGGLGVARICATAGGSHPQPTAIMLTQKIRPKAIPALNHNLDLCFTSPPYYQMLPRLFEPDSMFLQSQGLSQQNTNTPAGRGRTTILQAQRRSGSRDLAWEHVER